MMPVAVTAPPSATVSTVPIQARPALEPEPEIVTEKRGGSGSDEKRGGSGSVPDVPSGCPLPPLANIQWEKRTDRPGYTAWHAPAGTQAHRQTKTYLGYAGKRLLAVWARLSASERQQTIEAWIAAAKAKKGLPQ